MGSNESMIKKKQELNRIKMLELIIIRITRYRFDVHDLARNCHFLAKNDRIQLIMCLNKTMITLLFSTQNYDYEARVLHTRNKKCID